MEYIEKIYIKNKLELSENFHYFYNWFKFNFGISLIVSENSSLKNSIILELENNKKLILNEINSCEAIFLLSSNNDDEDYYNLLEKEELKYYLKDYILGKKKINEDFYEKIENEMINKKFFLSDKLHFVDFLLFCVFKKHKVENIKEKYINISKWFSKNNVNIKEGDISSITNTNFIQQIIEDDLKKKKHIQVITRFPPEPNGYLHLGHAKSICLNFGLSEKYGGRTHLRFDDTNPVTEEIRYIESIKEDVKWLGFDWKEHLYFASDYFDQLYEWAVQLIKQGDAYVDDQTIEEIRKTRGSLKVPGVNSPYRNRSVEENLELFEKMKKGEYKEGERVLRAKIDMTSGNINMRDPILYRIMHKVHPKSKDKWVIYPMYDFAHGQSDSIEKITHSICTLEFETHRPLYEWFQEKLNIFRTRQIEFARLNLTYMVMSKRKLLTLVNEKWVKDWDDPRMPTISGMRRRGYSPEAIKDFCSKVGVAKRENMISFDLLELCAREDMNKKAIRLFGVLKPLKVVITNFDENLYKNSDFYVLTALNHPRNDNMGSRTITFEKEIFIDEEDFQEFPSEDFYRLAPKRTVRLRYAFCITCNEVIKDEKNNIIELRCTYDHNSKSGTSENSKKVKSTIHWVSKKNSILSEFRIYDKLFTKANPESNDDDYDIEKYMNNFIFELNDNNNTNNNSLDYSSDFQKDNDNNKEENINDINNVGWRKYINKNSLVIHKGLVEKYSMNCKVGDPIQFERIGYFTKDNDSTDDLPVFNLTVALVDNFSLKKKKDELIKKEMDKIKREKIANERRLKKEEKKIREQKKKEQV
ncbi:glutamine--tRNA ligase, putative [Plasmodium gallinaceum]|uniref:glutamine--tRNA ligase n=1 Tax=Plasmodium gallinaceum TaxID=5849 RepID=A0A1J1GRA1_PLAGA|nr:glutamine--tRNA ligase, putative [Plasmodium gallinaceum]CRG95041.1 glutamine--tRNA ligase, putative [Plasmodium gallinaceum]